MLARQVIKARLPAAAAKTAARSVSTATPVNSFQQTAQSEAPVETSAVSAAELAWCEIYGVDYDREVQHALDESPLLLNGVAARLAVPRAASPAGTPASAKTDIWSVVFGKAA